MKKVLLSIIILVACICCLSSCGIFEKIFPCKHETYADKIVPPTCTAEGYTEHICTKCEESYKDTFTQKVAHPYVSVVVNPTCTAEGYTTHTCTECGNSYTDSTTAKVAHSYTSAVTAPTCTAEGYTSHTCTECGNSYKDATTAKLAHSYTSVVTAPTCIAQGYTTHTCTECGDNYKDGYTQNILHPYKDVVVSPTCTSEGYTEHICEVCNESYKDTVVAKVPHTYGAVVTPPTCAAMGYTTHTCTVCNDSYTDSETEATSHRFNASACLYCSMEEITETITPDTEWYNIDLVSMTLTTKEELAGLASLVNSGTTFVGQTIYLGADIELGYAEWIPIGNAEYAFGGTFDGEGYTIKELKINAAYSYVGLFGKVTGSIQDLTVDGASIYAAETYDYVSIVCGYSSGTISNVNAIGFIDANHSNYVGAITGYITLGISNCTAGGEIFGGSYVGGIAGYSDVSSAVYASLSYNGSVNGGDYTGGLIGNLSATSSIQTDSLTFTGSVSGAKHTGGIVGYIKGAAGSKLYGANVSANVTGGCYVGGIAGEASSVAISGSSNEGSTIIATSYETVDSTMYAYLGGYVGKGYNVDGAINNANINYALRGLYVGGIAGYLTNNATNCENNGNVFGYDYVGGIVGNLQSTTTNPVSNLKNSGNISGNNYVGGIFGRYANTSNINLLNLENSGKVNATGYQGGGIAGSCDATGKTLIAENLKNTGAVTVTDKQAGGLFGYITANTSSVIKNSESSADVSGKYYVGGLVGQSVNVSVENCSNEGSTITATGWYTESSTDYVWLGGYVGYGYKVSGCTNNSNITYFGNGKYVGGIIGYAQSAVTNCVNNGNIESTAGYVGGVAGQLDSNINYNLTYSDLSNYGNIRGIDYVGGVAGLIHQNVYVGQTENGTTNLITRITNVQNSGQISGNVNVGGLFGYIYCNNTYYYNNGLGGWSGKVHTGYSYLIAQNFENLGNVSGISNVGELTGYFYTDAASTLTTYTVTGSVTLNGEVKTDTYDVGTKTNLTLSGRVVYVPETEGETEEGETEDLTPTEE